MDRKRGNDKIADFEDNYYSIGGSGVDIVICGVDQDIFICNQVNNKVNINRISRLRSLTPCAKTKSAIIILLC